MKRKETKREMKECDMAYDKRYLCINWHILVFSLINNVMLLEMMYYLFLDIKKFIRKHNTFFFWFSS